MMGILKLILGRLGSVLPPPGIGCDVTYPVRPGNTVAGNHVGLVVNSERVGVLVMARNAGRDVVPTRVVVGTTSDGC